MNLKNPLLNTDSYKASHWLQYPPGTQNVSSYIEARESKNGKYKCIVPYGLQIALKEYLQTPITQSDINEAAEFWAAHGEPFNEAGWQYIVDNHGGYMPVKIWAVPEGKMVPTGVPILRIEATDEKCFWVVSYLETMLLRAFWYGTTVATQSWHLKNLIKSYLEKTGDVAGLPFKLHDFGARGVSSFESAGIGGSAHLVNFMGTDTVTGALFAKKYYNEKGMPAFSIPAAEHSTITSWGDLEIDEKNAYENMIDQYSKEGSIYAVVSDSRDIYNAVKNIWGKQLHDKVLAKKGLLVIRPDSGHPATVVTKIIRDLDEAFGSTMNAKGYKVLNGVRVIQGDGINSESIKEILNWVTSAGYSADNVAFGMGGALLQGVNRDTLSFAMKASAIKINGKWKHVFKNPVTDSEKKSKSGRQTTLESRGTIFASIIEIGDSNGAEYTWTDSFTKELMVPVFKDGTLLQDWTFAEIRARAEEGLPVREVEAKAA